MEQRYNFWADRDHYQRGWIARYMTPRGTKTVKSMPGCAEIFDTQGQALAAASRALCIALDTEFSEQKAPPKQRDPWGASKWRRSPYRHR